MKVSVSLLRNQRDFLLEYPWNTKELPEEVDGVINLLDYILDLKEGFIDVEGNRTNNQ